MRARETADSHRGTLLQSGRAVESRAVDRSPRRPLFRPRAETERGRFELPLPLRADRFSKPARSAAPPPLQGACARTGKVADSAAGVKKGGRGSCKLQIGDGKSQIGRPAGRSVFQSPDLHFGRRGDQSSMPFPPTDSCQPCRKRSRCSTVLRCPTIFPGVAAPFHL
jgi:hypothetical protein